MCITKNNRLFTSTVRLDGCMMQSMYACMHRVDIIVGETRCGIPMIWKRATHHGAHHPHLSHNYYLFLFSTGGPGKGHYLHAQSGISLPDESRDRYGIRLDLACQDASLFFGDYTVNEHMARRHVPVVVKVRVGRFLLARTVHFDVFQAGTDVIETKIMKRLRSLLFLPPSLP